MRSDRPSALTDVPKKAAPGSSGRWLARRFTAAAALSLLLAAGAIETRRSMERRPSQSESEASLEPTAVRAPEARYRVLRYRGDVVAPPLLLYKRLTDRTSESVLFEETWVDSETSAVVATDRERRYDRAFVERARAFTDETLRAFCSRSGGSLETLYLQRGRSEACRIEYEEEVDGTPGRTTTWIGAGTLLGEIQREWKATNGSSSVSYELLSDRNNP